MGRSGPGRDRPVADRPGRVRDDALEVQLDAPSGSLAAGTGTQRTVESEQVDLGLEMIGPALAAPPASHECARRIRQAAGIGPGRERRPSRSNRACAGGVLTANQTVHDHIGDTGRHRGGGSGQAVRRQLDELPVEPGSRQAVLEQGAKDRGGVRARQDLQGKPDLVASPLGKLVDGP